VKDRDHAGLGVEIFAIRADDVNGLNRRRLEQDVVAERLVLEWRRHGEIRDLQEFGVAIGEPFRSRQALALRTVPVAAGIIGDAGFAAVLALLCPPSAAVQRQTPSATQVCRARLAPKAKDLLQALLDALVDIGGPVVQLSLHPVLPSHRRESGQAAVPQYGPSAPHDRCQLPVRSRLAARAQRKWRRQRQA
jgi:hypothetical protein